VNLYFLVEGRSTERKVYRAWVATAFPGLREVRSRDDMTDGTFQIVSTDGYPDILMRIDEVVGELVDNPAIDHLFVCLDADDVDVTTRREEITARLDDAVATTRLRDVNPTARLHPIVQDCCIETWFLGHRKMMKASPEDPELRRYWQSFDVRTTDPERLPNHGAPTRAAHHLRYLVAMFRERPPASYGKTHPGPVLDGAYLRELASRVAATGHLQSLRALLDVWRGLGAQLS
jgi:hypothetical protein